MVIIAVTLIIVTFASLYILSVIYPPMERGLETLQVRPDSFISINGSECVAYIHLYSNIKPQLEIKYIEIGNALINMDNSVISIYKTEKGNVYFRDGTLILTPGSSVWIKVYLDRLNETMCINLGAITQIRLYSSQGYIYVGTIIKK